MTDLFALRSTDSEPTDPHEFLAVFLHGYGSDERDLAGLSGYLPLGLPWASVRAPLRHPAFGYSWYPLEGEFSPAEAIAEATEALWAWVDTHVAPGVQIVPIGFSQGAMMASQLLRTRPERIGVTVALSGYVSDTPRPADAALAQSRPRVFWGRGDQDPVIPAHEVAAAGEWFEAHTSLERHVYPGMGHSVSEEELVDIRQFLARTLG
ncbi:alpha/beta hydrolase [Demequina oxidasica]|uniref:alpha/beta hydrolase n=1 Tax=Demequina oxidasica TaxID=676199 RepID=UPI000782B433|nr:dienelactone hydrolase family protein [Demequina oxidasica]